MRPEQRFADADRNPATAYELGRHDGERKAAAAAEVRGEAMTPAIDAEEVVRNCTHLGTGACIGCVADAVAAERQQVEAEYAKVRKDQDHREAGFALELAEAVAAEREACAKEPERLAEPLRGHSGERQDGGFVALTRAAAAIRARGEPVYPDGEPLQCQNADAISKIDFAAAAWIRLQKLEWFERVRNRQPHPQQIVVPRAMYERLLDWTHANHDRLGPDISSRDGVLTFQRMAVVPGDERPQGDLGGRG